MKTAILFFSFLAAASPACAEEAHPNRAWKDSSELSYVKTSGNTRTATLSAKNLFNRDWEKTALEVIASGLGTESNSVVTAEQYNTSAKFSLKFPGSNYAFQKTAWNKDRFAGIKDRYEFSLGVGRNLLNSAGNKLYTEAGGGHVLEDRLRSENKSFSTYRGYIKYIRTLSPTANTSQDLEFIGNLQDADGYRMNAETALVTTINSHFSLKASYAWKFSNNPGDGFGKTDTTTSLAVIFNY